MINRLSASVTFKLFQLLVAIMATVSRWPFERHWRDDMGYVKVSLLGSGIWYCALLLSRFGEAQSLLTYNKGQPKPPDAWAKHFPPLTNDVPTSAPTPPPLVLAQVLAQHSSSIPGRGVTQCRAQQPRSLAVMWWCYHITSTMLSLKLLWRTGR